MNLTELNKSYNLVNKKYFFASKFNWVMRTQPTIRITKICFSVIIYKAFLGINILEIVFNPHLKFFLGITHSFDQYLSNTLICCFSFYSLVFLCHKCNWNKNYWQFFNKIRRYIIGVCGVFERCAHSSTFLASK